MRKLLWMGHRMPVCLEHCCPYKLIRSDTGHLPRLWTSVESAWPYL